MGCAYVQGYLLSRPAPAGDVEPLLSRSLLPVLRAQSAP
jgi:EAL domain-containing protein (putative c-di-GMP-specific phosphodiesterase class I)